jgi:tetratricopeptide (TPR) repeat protein
MTLTVIRQWIEKVAKNHKRFPGLEFERAYLVELCGLFNDSEQALKELIQNHPAYSPAFYRLAQLELSRGNVLAARKLFEQCLEIEPGHWGSLSEMARLAGIESDFKNDAKYRRSIYDRLPYSMRYLFDTTMAIKGANGASAATDFMTANQSRFGDCSFRVGQARYFFEIGETEQAKMLVQDVPLDNEFGYAAAWVRLDCAVRQENFDEAEVIMEPMLKKWPKDRDLIDQVARLFRLRSPAVAAAFACEKLKEGIDLPVLAYIAIQNEKRPYEKVTEVLSLTQTENREAVALSFFEALDRPAFDRDCMQFLEFCSNTFPRLQGLRETYASRLMLRNEHLKSVAISKALLDEEPENPRWMELYGMCIQDKDPKGSIAVLEKAYQLTGSTHVLSRLARGHNANGDKQKAKDTYLAVIALNPQDTIAIVNLMLLFDVMDDAMWMRVNSCLDTGAGSDTQYFHVMAVKLALKLGKPLSTAWFDGAQRRFADLANQPSFRDEKTCLDRALNAWLHVRPIKGVKVGSFISRLIGRFYWPGLAWIPRE